MLSRQGAIPRSDPGAWPAFRTTLPLSVAVQNRIPPLEAQFPGNNRLSALPNHIEDPLKRENASV
jgi:hypothetical protein